MGENHISVKFADENKRRKAAEADLADANEIFSLLVDAVEDYAIFALDPGGNILTWNAGGKRLKGYSADEIIGKHFSIFYTQPDVERQHPQEELEIATREGKYEEEGWRVRKDGSRFWANVVITALRDQNGNLHGFGKVTRDLTERRQASLALEEKVKERTRDLSEAKSRLEQAIVARDRFFSMASHELKTPLSSLKMQAQLRKRNVLRKNFSDFAPERLLALCEDDERQVNRLAILVENMLDISKLTAGAYRLDYEKVNLKSLIEEVVDLLKPNLDDGQNECRIECSSEIEGEWDRTRIGQVLTNLISNCAKYAPGSPITIAADDEKDQVQISLKDQGPGIPEDKHSKIFEPFERVHVDAASGLGLGLYIVNQIVESHGGSIALISRRGQGTEFRIVLPKSKKGENQ